jgi:2,4-dienoyl-CoA reductase-like NADH-dependent reductase (Old Yellow Enzyme family)
MSKLFETTEINSLVLKNRFVRSATWEGMAGDDGSCTPQLVDLLETLADGGIGLIITSHAYVSPKGQAGPWQLGIYKDDLVSGLREMTDKVHEKGSRVVAQISHAGYFANPKLIGETPAAPSAVSGFTKTPRREMSLREIQEIVEAFGQGAVRAKAAGFDGIQIHAAHGYMLSQFLSPAFNKRKDQYGGNIENRTRIVREVMGAVREQVGRNYPVLIKMNSRDFLIEGVELEDAIETGQILKEAGLDAIELSGGTLVSGDLNPSRTGILSEEKEAYFKDAAVAFKNTVDLPLILVGGIRSFHVAEQLVEDNTADYISMSRPLIREPDLIKRWQSGDRSKATCLSDSKCFEPALGGKGIYCVVEKAIREGKRTKSDLRF